MCTYDAGGAAEDDCDEGCRGEEFKIAGLDEREGDHAFSPFSVLAWSRCSGECLRE